MRRRQLVRADAPTLSVRAARFEDLPAILRLIERAIGHGCRDHYDRAQRRAVYAGYASNLFADAVGPFQTLVAEIGGQLNAVPFYLQAGFLPCDGPARLLSAGLRVPVAWMEKSLRA